MNNIAKYLAYGLGAFSLCLGSFLTFAILSGTPLHEMAIVGGMFPEPRAITGTGEGIADPLEDLATDSRPRATVLDQASIPLQAFVLQSPFTTERLESLQTELKSAIHSNEQLALELGETKAELDRQRQHIEDRWNELDLFRDKLVERDLELQSLSDELERDVAAQSEKERAQWVKAAKLFEKGKTKDLARNLTLYPPTDAAKILSALEGERAAEILAAVPPDRYLEYAEAFRKAGP